MAISVGELLAYLRLDSAQFDRGITVAREGMTTAAGSATRLGGAVGLVDVALANAGKQANVASAGSAKFRAAQLGATAATEKYNAVLADENATIRQLSLAEKGLITANERLRVVTMGTTTAFTEQGAAAAAATAEMGGMRTGMASTLATVGKLGIGLGAIGLLLAGISATKQAVAFQRDMLLVQTQAGATEESIKGLSAAVLAMAGQVATSPDKLANSLYHAYSVGLKDKQALDAVKIAAEGAAVGHSDLEETTNAMTAAVASGIPGVQNMSKAMGSLLTIVGAGDMKLSDLNDAMGSGILVVSKQFGLSLTDVGAALATFGDNNIRGANAATMLRVSIMAMAKPVAGGVKLLKSMGLSAESLARDMQHGGLNQALVDLANHLGQAGYTGSKVGEVLTQIFGKKAGPGISVLIDQLQRFQTKTDEINKGADSFAGRWAATTKSAGFQLDKLATSAESAAISLTGKLTPAVTTAAHWLSTDLPHALGVLQAALGPTEHMIGVGLVTAWHAASATLGVAAHALSGIGHFLAEHKMLVEGVVVPVLAMWAAWKAYTIVSTAYFAVRAAITGIALTTKAELGAAGSAWRSLNTTMLGGAKESSFVALSLERDFATTAAAATEGAAKVAQAEYVKASAFLETARASGTASEEEILAAEASALAAEQAATATAVAAAETATAAETAAAAVVASGDAAKIGWMGVLGPIGLVAVAATTVFSLFHHGSSDTAAVTAAVGGLTEALKADNQALGDHVRAQIESNLVSENAYQAATRLGISQKTLTDAAMGNKAALTQVNDALAAANLHHKDNLISVGLVSGALDIQSKALKTSVQNQKDLTAAGTQTAKSLWSVNLANLDATPAQVNLTNAVKDYKTAVADATSAVLLLGQTELAQAGSEDAFKEGILNMAAAVKQNGHSLSDQTLKGLANRDMLNALLSSAGEVAKTQQANHVAAPKIVKDYEARIKAIETEAAKLGLSKQAVADYIAQMHLTPKDIATSFQVDTSQAAAELARVKLALENLTRATHYITLQVKYGGATSNFLNSQISSGRASGGMINGPGTDTSDSILTPTSRGEFVVRASQARKHISLLQSINSGGSFNGPTRASSASGVSSGGGSGAMGALALKIGGGKLEITRDSAGHLEAWVRDIVLDEADHTATIGRMHTP